ncbi:MAG: (Fe-S)-binding protein [bacterium]
MLDSHRKSIDYCTYCPKLCRFSCPVAHAESRETVTPTEKMKLLHLARSGAASMDEDAADVMYRCAACMTCRAFCKHRIAPPEAIVAARGIALRRGAAPDAVVKYVAEFEKHRNPFGEALSAKMEETGVAHRVGRNARIAYFPGCNTLYYFPGVVRAVEKTMIAAGVDFAVHGGAGAPMCCGIPAYYAGARESFAEIAEKNAAALKKYDTVIVTCPECLVALKQKYAEIRARVVPEVVHFTAFALDLLEKGKVWLKPPLREKVFYHDPCHLAKHLGVVAQPRALLDRLVSPESIVEFSWNRDKGLCCGGGGLLPVAAPETAARIAKRRLAELRETDAATLVTACPQCEHTFASADPELIVRDVAALLADQLDETHAV